MFSLGRMKKAQVRWWFAEKGEIESNVAGELSERGGENPGQRDGRECL